ncbi:MAG: dihydrofolate reductase family protein [Leptospira sp.]|nr:dihydrofolate reductase family protein [Leptospira sp.]
METKNLKKIIQKIISLSFLAMGRTSPNPPVAAVICDDTGNILVSGNTQITGLNHAEREAYLLFDKNHFAIKSDKETSFISHQLFVSLEPCTHFGKTPPCKDLILQKHPNSLIMGWRDPNPLIETGIWDDYKTANIETKLHPLLAKGSLPFLHGFFQRIKKNRPWVFVKSAITSDGFYAANDNQRIAISSEGSNFYLQMLRAKFDAIVVGPNTIELDSPSLDFRLDEKSFYAKGEVSKIDFGNISDFFSHGEQLLDSLFSESNAESYSEHLAEIHTYQPWRIFILKEGMKLPLDFIQKQNDLNEKYGKKLCLFYLLISENRNITIDDSNINSNIKELFSLTDHPITKISMHDGEKFLNHLAKLGINTVIFEAGSFLWEFIKNHMDSNDCILTIQSPKELNEGKTFLGINQYEKQAHFQVGSDLWQLEMKT